MTWITNRAHGPGPYRARLKASDGRGEFFPRGLDQPLQGSSEWATYEIPFFLNEPGLQADLVKLNVAFESGGGAVWVKDVQPLHTPLFAHSTCLVIRCVQSASKIGFSPRARLHLRRDARRLHSPLR
jgi:hypothetical protein